MTTKNLGMRWAAACGFFFILACFCFFSWDACYFGKCGINLYLGVIGGVSLIGLFFCGKNALKYINK